MFAFPVPDESQSVGSTNTSPLEVGTLREAWKAKRAVRDTTLVQRLCDTLQNILGDLVLPADYKDSLLEAFSPQLEINGRFGIRRNWLRNPNEAHVRIFHC
jgi:hypothetical protein